MKKLFLAASVAVVLMAASAPAANATTTLNRNLPSADGSFTASFEGHDIAAATTENPTFADIFTWDLELDGTMSGIIASIFSARSGDINFTSVSLDGQEFDLTRDGPRDNGFLEELVVHRGSQQMIVRGTSGGNGSYGGVLSFAAAALTGGVPEPASWALMIVGFGGIGATLRCRRRQALAA